MATKPRSRGGAALVTGATGFIGKRVALALAQRGRRLFLLCRPQSIPRLEPVLEEIAKTAPAPTVVPGDLLIPGLGIQADERARLRKNVREVFHLAATYDLGMTDQEGMATNVEGTRRVLDLAADLPGLRRFHYVSTLAVAGDYPHMFRPDDLDVGQGFDYAYGRSKFLAERNVRERAGSIPTTIYRPGVVVGDSTTGEMDKVDGPYYLFQVLRTLKRIPGVTRMPMIVPREQDSYLHVVPVDYVVAALVELAGQEDTVGQTHHLLDPEPLTYRDFYLATLRAMGFAGPAVSRPLARLVKLLRRDAVWPIARAVSRRLGMPAEMLCHYLYPVTYDTTSTTRVLEPHGIRCPRVRDYLPTLIAYFEAHLAA